MDVRKFAVSPTGRLHLRDANGKLMYTDDKQPIAANLYGPGSKEYAHALTNRSNRMVDKLKESNKSEQTTEQRIESGAEFLADCTHSFENLDYDGAQGRELAIAVYSDITIGFIADQVSNYIGRWENFTKASPQS